jgi:hypothetical protein
LRKNGKITKGLDKKLAENKKLKQQQQEREPHQPQIIFYNWLDE